MTSPARSAVAGAFSALVLTACSLATRAAEPDRPPPGVVKYVRFQTGQTVAYGVVEGNLVRQLDGDLFGQWKMTDRTHELSSVKLLVPCRPSKVLATAINYRSHAGTQAVPAHPELFYKPPSCLLAHEGEIVIPKGSNDVHYEAELVVVIGRRARNVPVEKAKDYVLGVTCGNDISARDWQKNDKQWWRAKGADTFGPCGPFIASGLDYDDLAIELRLNGEVKQAARTSEMVHNVAAIVSWASRHVTLEPGDLIYTGTPGTTSALKPGDRVEVRIEGLGVLSNRVVAER